ncbi:hypothetical protein [Flavobacterium sp. GSA192]|nr:hypothetical protein [Flavobacterium sp. GSA192]
MNRSYGTFTCLIRAVGSVNLVGMDFNPSTFDEILIECRWHGQCSK